MRKCDCTLRQKLVGDGCDICNPTLTIEHLKEHIVDLKLDIISTLEFFISDLNILITEDSCDAKILSIKAKWEAIIKDIA